MTRPDDPHRDPAGLPLPQPSQNDDLLVDPTVSAPEDDVSPHLYDDALLDEPSPDDLGLPLFDPTANAEPEPGDEEAELDLDDDSVEDGAEEEDAEDEDSEDEDSEDEDSDEEDPGDDDSQDSASGDDDAEDDEDDDSEVEGDDEEADGDEDTESEAEPDEPAAHTAAADTTRTGKPGRSDPSAPSSTSAAGADYASGRTFKDFPISPELLKAVEEHGYAVATAVQAASIEPGLAGRDLLVRAKTGTGKTAAFAIPILERVTEGARHAQALVLSPTRELAVQSAAECGALAKYKDLRVCAVYGGVPIGPQAQALKDGVEVVVGTPGRILDHIRRGNLDLSRCRIACLDEADEMLSMGFLEEVTAILERLGPSPQMLLFSATVDEKVTHIIQRYLKNPEHILLSTDTDRVEGIRHVLYETDPDVHKVRSLLAVLDKEQPAAAIIFCNTREDVNTVGSFLGRQGMDVQVLSGDVPQKQRDEVMARVKRGEVQYLVASDVAARGIDITDLSHVINYSLPSDPALYLHRSGRTGRIGKNGVAISLAGGTDLHTRHALERDYAIAFEVQPLPSQEEAARLRLTQLAKRLEEAVGVSAFEAFLPTVRALKERPDGDRLLAVAVRTFFLWDRMQRAIAAGTDPTPPRKDDRSRPAQGRGEDGGGDRRPPRDGRDQDGRNRGHRRRRSGGRRS